MKTASPIARVSLVVAFALAAGCATVNTVTPAVSEAVPSNVAHKINITDSSLNSIAHVEGVNESMAGDLKRVQVTLRNLSSGAKSITYKFQWLDRQAMAITSPAPVTQTAFLEGGQTVFINSTAPTPNAVDWNLTLMESVRRTPGQLP